MNLSGHVANIEWIGGACYKIVKIVGTGEEAVLEWRSSRKPWFIAFGHWVLTLCDGGTDPRMSQSNWMPKKQL